MKKISMAVVAGLAFISLNAFGAGKTYQVTGPILEVTDSAIIVQKGTDKWELQKDSMTKVNGGDLKAGNKVTIEYIMTAKTVEVKGDTKAKAEAKTEAKPTAKSAAKADTKAEKPK